MFQKIRPIFLFKILLLPLVIYLGTCTPQKSGWQGSVEVVDGVRIIKNPSSPLHPELKIIFEEDLTIGVEDGDEHYMFGDQVFLNVDKEGHIYVTVGERKTIRRYDPAGKFIQSLGGPGQGPGEFQDISVVRFDTEGDIYLNDTKQQRLSFLSREGQHIRGIKFPSLFEKVVLNSQGLYIARYVDNVELGKGKKWDYVYGLFDDQFRLKAEFLRLSQGVDLKSKNGQDALAEMFADSLSRSAFVPVVNYVLDDMDNIYFGYPVSDKYEIRVYSPEGKLTNLIQRDHEPIAITRKHKACFEQTQSGLMQTKTGALDPSLRQKVYALVEYPEYLPAFERFILMENGWLLVVVESAQSGGRSTLVDIFSKEGEYLAQFETDIATDWLCFQNGKAYAVAAVDDYKYIKRYNFSILGYTESGN